MGPLAGLAPLLLPPLATCRAALRLALLALGAVLVVGTAVLTIHQAAHTRLDALEGRAGGLSPYCTGYATQTDAQAAYDAYPRLLARLDGDHDGVACERLP